MGVYLCMQNEIKNIKLKKYQRYVDKNNIEYFYVGTYRGRRMLQMSPYHNGEKLVSAMTLHLSPNETMELELKPKRKDISI
jgi:hypothetical protein